MKSIDIMPQLGHARLVLDVHFEKESGRIDRLSRANEDEWKSVR